MHNAIPSIFLPLLVEVLEKGGVRFASGGGTVTVTRTHTDLENALALWLSQRSHRGELSILHLPTGYRRTRPIAEDLLHAGARRERGERARACSLTRAFPGKREAQHQRRNAHGAVQGGTVISLFILEEKFCPGVKLLLVNSHLLALPSKYRSVPNTQTSARHV